MPTPDDEPRDEDLTPANPGVAAFMARRAQEATPEQRRRAAVAHVVVAQRLRPLPVAARTRGCSRAVRPRSRARRSPRASRAGPSDDDGGSGEPAPGPARPDLIGGAR